MSNGWIKLHRRLLDWEWYGDLPTFKLFIHLLLTANHETKQWRGITIKRGQRVIGRDKLAEETGLSVRSVRTSLERLKTTNEVAIETTNQFSIVTINKYNDYQISEKVDQQNDQRSGQRTTSKRPLLKNDKNEKKKETTTGRVEDPLRTKILKHLRSIGIVSPEGYLQSLERKTNNAAAIEWAWRDWNNGGIIGVTDWYSRCLHHAGVRKQ